MFYYYKLFWMNALNIQHRSRRKEFWYPLLITIIVSFLGSMFINIVSLPHVLSNAIYWIFTIATYIATFSVTTRRFHDLGMTMLFPIVANVLGVIVTIYDFFFNVLDMRDIWKVVFIILCLIYVLLNIITLVICCIDGENRDNQYGKNPKMK